MKSCITFFLSIAVCLQALGTEISSPNCISLYFDESAEVHCLEDVEFEDLVSMYVVMTNPTEDFIYGFEFGFDVVGEALLLTASYNHPTLLPNSFNNFIVGYPEPMPAFQATVLVWVDLLYQDNNLGPVDFFPHGSIPSSIDPAYPTILLENGELVLGNILTDGSAMAQINGGCNVVANESISFDNLKSLFR